MPPSVWVKRTPPNLPSDLPPNLPPPPSSTTTHTSPSPYLISQASFHEAYVRSASKIPSFGAPVVALGIVLVWDWLHFTPSRTIPPVSNSDFVENDLVVVENDNDNFPHPQAQPSSSSLLNHHTYLPSHYLISQGCVLARDLFHEAYVRSASRISSFGAPVVALGIVLAWDWLHFTPSRLFLLVISSDDEARAQTLRPRRTAKLSSRLTDANNDATPELRIHQPTHTRSIAHGTYPTNTTTQDSSKRTALVVDSSESDHTDDEGRPKDIPRRILMWHQVPDEEYDSPANGRVGRQDTTSGSVPNHRRMQVPEYEAENHLESVGSYKLTFESELRRACSASGTDEGSSLPVPVALSTFLHEVECSLLSGGPNPLSRLCRDFREDAISDSILVMDTIPYNRPRLRPRPGLSQARALHPGPAWDLSRPKPPQARPEPGLSGQAGPDPSLVVVENDDDNFPHPSSPYDFSSATLSLDHATPHMPQFAILPHSKRPCLGFAKGATEQC
ncbi:hypothetical protein BU15DRAFT_63324 [Melanogaster broomeanus]|nr:hypothetical protein BU15DRAFT_63324 [Melanogaster broomeanus]